MPSVERGAVRQHNNLPQRSKASGPATSSTTAADKRHKAAPDDKEKLSASQASTSKGIRPKEDRRTQHSSTNSAHQRNLTPTNIETFLLRPSISEETRQSFPSLDIGLIDSEITIGGPQNYSAGTRHENASDCLATEVCCLMTTTASLRFQSSQSGRQITQDPVRCSKLLSESSALLEWVNHCSSRPRRSPKMDRNCPIQSPLLSTDVFAS